MSKKNRNASPMDLDGTMPLLNALPLGIQHVLAMFVGNLLPLILVTSACGIAAGNPELLGILLQNAMITAGIGTLIQIYGLGPIGGRLPIVMGTSSGFIGVTRGAAVTIGGITGYGAVLGAGLIGGIFEMVLGFFLKPLRKFFPSVVTGTVVLSIGLSLIIVGVNSFAGGAGKPDFGSLENLFVGFIVMCVIIGIKHWTKGFLSYSSILVGIIVGYILVGSMGMILENTSTYIDKSGAVVNYTKSWVLDWSRVASAKWFSLPKLFPVKYVFDLRAIIPIGVMFIVTAVETIGDTSGITEGGLGREATDKELSGAVLCDGFNSAIASVFGVLPHTSFSQNVGLIGMTKVVNRFAISTGGVFLILCGLFPKLAALIGAMPQSVLGGAAIIIFASIILSGIGLITKDGLTSRKITIVSVALGLGFGLGSNTNALNQMPELVRLIFGGSGIVPAAALAIILNIVLPKESVNEENSNKKEAI